jgi:heterodisulfide reductase subunit B
MTDLLLFNGCLIPSRLPFLEKATRDVLDKLEVSYSDLPDQTCCVEPIGLRSLGADTWTLASARLLAIAEESDGDILTVCDGCYMSLNQTILRLEDPRRREAVNRELARIGREYHGRVRVLSLVELLHSMKEGIIGSVSEPQKRRFAIHPGCHLERTAEELGKEDPVKQMADIVEWVGGTPVELRGNCCGGGLSGVYDDMSKAVLDDSLAAFKGSDTILTPCPTCFVQFDLRQKDGIPVWFLTEMLIAAFGMDYKGWRYHRSR